MMFSRLRKMVEALVSALLRPVANQNGAVIIFAVASTLLVMAYYANKNDLLGNLDGYRQYARDSAEGNPDTDRNALRNALQAEVSTVGPGVGAAVLAPLTPSSSIYERISATLTATMEYQNTQQIQQLVAAGIEDPHNVPSGPQAAGQPGSVAACGISLDPWQAVAPGDFVFINVKVPSIFRGEITRTYGSASNSGLFYNSADGGYTASWTVPGSYCSGNAVATFTAENINGEVVCSVSASIVIDYSGLPDADSDFIPDSCEVDDDNDGSPDTADCAPTDPSRYPGNTEICGDDIDQDCDGADLPCEIPCTPADGCCAEFPLSCGGDCYEADSVCCGGTAYLPGVVCCSGEPFEPGAVCCPGGGACPAGDECCSGGCIPAGKVCCPNGFCDPGESCCGTTCCFPGAYCASPGVCKPL